MDAEQPQYSSERPPLGLNLDFLFGRGYLWTHQERLSDWITLETLRMEIPDLQFPFDARGGLHRFRNTRCLVREVEFHISEVGLSDLLQRAAAELDGFRDLRLRFLDDAIHLGLRLRAFGAESTMSFRAALVPPEPARADELHLSLFDYRHFGPLPYPARLMATELLRSLLETSTLRPPGRGGSFSVETSGDLLRFRPLKLLLLHIFPRVGWKLPDLSDVVLEGARVRPGMLTIRASSRQEGWRRPASPPSFGLAASPAGAQAIAAYEAKELFGPVDRAIFDGQLQAALDVLSGYRAVYGLHDELVGRLLDLLLAEGGPAALAEAEALVRQLERDDPTSLRAALARPSLALLANDRPRARRAYEALAALLRDRRELEDWVLAELAHEALLEEDGELEEAAARLREILRAFPRHRVTLQRLQRLYERLGDADGLEEVLKRLTGIYTERERLRDTYLALARHLMDRKGEVQEARIYLEKVLRLAPTELGALFALGESYLLSDEPLRALKAFGSAARAAEKEGLLRQAADLYLRMARIWEEVLHDPGAALLACRQALELVPPAAADGADEELRRAETLETAARLSQVRDRWEEATGYLTDAVPLLERQAQARPEVVGRLVAAHLALGELYVERGRVEAATSHWRRVLDLEPSLELAERLGTFYHERGRPERLLELYLGVVDRLEEAEERATVHLRLASVYEAMMLVEETREHLQAALQLDPQRAEARQRLVALLERVGRYETLRDTLSALLVRTRERQARLALLLDLGALYAGPLEQPRSAARTFLEALGLEPANLRALRGVRQALSRYVVLHGPQAPGLTSDARDASSLQQSLLQRLSEVSDDPQERIEVLGELAQVARQRNNEGAQREAERRLRALQAQPGGVEPEGGAAPVPPAPEAMSDGRPWTTVGPAGGRGQEQSADLEERLDAFLGPQPQGPPGRGLEEVSRSLAPPVRRNAFERIGPVPEEPAEAPEAPLPPTEGELEAFRSRMQGVLRTPGQVPGGGAEGSPLGKMLERSRRDLHGPPPGPLRLPVEEDKAADDEDSDPEIVVTLVDPRPPVMRLGEEASTAAGEGVAALPTRSGPALALEAAVDAARRKGSPQALAEALLAALDAHDAPGEPVRLEPDRYLAMAREAAELLYYDLDAIEDARPLLELVQGLDPQGFAARPALLNALESIYEEQGAVAERIRLLEMRLETTQSPDMEVTYRLLLAQLAWEARGDRGEATRWLEPILARDARHEAVHRFLGDVASEEEDWEAAAGHLRVVLEEGHGGLDEVEIERKLADILLHRLHRAEEAAAHFEHLLGEAPADAQALEGLKACRAALGDWGGISWLPGAGAGVVAGAATA